jgi:hypothetical protein
LALSYVAALAPCSKPKSTIYVRTPEMKKPFQEIIPELLELS